MSPRGPAVTKTTDCRTAGRSLGSAGSYCCCIDYPGSQWTAADPGERRTTAQIYCGPEAAGLGRGLECIYITMENLKTGYNLAVKSFCFFFFASPSGGLYQYYEWTV